MNDMPFHSSSPALSRSRLSGSRLLQSCWLPAKGWRIAVVGLVLGLNAVLALPAHAAEAPRIVATIGMIGDVAKTIGGACVEMEIMMGPGVDPHLYRASAGDVRALQEADAIFYAGHGLEGQLGEVLDKLGRAKTVLAVSEQSIDEGDLIETEGAYSIDPHLWMDVGLWAETVPVLAKTLAEIAPECGDDLEARAEAYADDLEALNGWIGASIKSIPAEQRILVTAHDAFAYYGRAYDIEVAGIQGLSTESEAGIADIRAMVDVVVRRSVPAIFVESTINPRTIQAVIDAAARRGQKVEIGGELYADAMGEASTTGGSYMGMLYANTVTIVRALGGTPASLPETLASRIPAENGGVVSP